MMILLITSVYSTDVTGEVYGIWTVAGSPYNILGTTTVPEGQSLVIQPGVNVIFHGNFNLTVQGQITAIGTEADSIRFFAAPDTRWNSIRLENIELLHTFSHCVITGGNIGISPINAKLYVSHCRIGFMLNNGISLHGLTIQAETMIRDSKIHDIDRIGIMVTQNSNVQILRNEITRCALTAPSGQGGIQISNQNSPTPIAPLIEGNWIHNNTWQGIIGFDMTGLGRVAPIVRNNLIERNHSGFNMLHTAGRIYNNIIRDNYIITNPNSGSGITFNGAGVRTVVEYNIITGNFTGIFVTGNALPDLGSNSDVPGTSKGNNVIMNNIFTYNPANDDFSIVMFPAHTANLNAMNNYFGSDIATEISTTITDNAVNPVLGTVNFQPFLTFADLNFNPPQNLTANPFNQRIVLTWEKPEWSHGILEGYRVYRNDVAFTGLIQTLEFHDTDVVNGTTYNYHVKAVYTIQTGVSVASNTATATPSEETGLSVTLLSFFTFISADHNVGIRWSTGSENNLLGFNIRRNTSSDRNTSYRINNHLINPSNSSVINEYTFIDTEILYGVEFFYWLEMLDNNSIPTFHGPISSIVEEFHVPCLPEKTSLSNVFPNPMRVNTVSNFDIDVKEGETASFAIFNIRGQLIHEVSDIIPGNHRISWNGRDKNDREVASGVYFYRLTSPSIHTVQRMVIVR